MDNLRVTVRYGSMAIKEFNKFENGRMVHYSYSITYDRNGVETSRTKPTKGLSIGWSDGSPFTEKDLKDISCQT